MDIFRSLLCFSSITGFLFSLFLRGFVIFCFVFAIMDFAIMECSLLLCSLFAYYLCIRRLFISVYVWIYPIWSFLNLKIYMFHLIWGIFRFILANMFFVPLSLCHPSGTPVAHKINILHIIWWITEVYSFFFFNPFI